MFLSDNSYDLVTDEWIPVKSMRGDSFRVGLGELIRSATALRALTGPPPVRIAILRLVTALLRDALGPAAIEEQAWRTWWETGRLPVDAVSAYLADYGNRFRLFDAERPFMQNPVMRADRTAVRSVAELAPHLPTGNNATLIHRTTDLGGANPATFTNAEAACWLVSFHAHTRPGITSSLDASPPGRVSGRAGPLLGRLVAVPEGDDLARTLLLNLPRQARHPLDLPAYRCDQPVRRGEDACGPVSLLSWTSRHVLLLPDTGGTVKAVKVAADDDVEPLVPRTTQALNDPHLLILPAERTP